MPVPNTLPPMCLFNIYQNAFLNSNDNNGCGKCGNKCATLKYCKTCCSNLYNEQAPDSCDFQIVSITEIINNTGATIDIPRSNTFIVS